jgi:hypothetical protein
VLTCHLVVLQLIAAVTLAGVIPEVVTSRVFEIGAPAMRHTSVALAIVHVDAAIMWLERAVCPASYHIAGEASESAIERISWLAREVRPVLELVLVHGGPSGIAVAGGLWYAT